MPPPPGGPILAMLPPHDVPEPDDRRLVVLGHRITET